MMKRKNTTVTSEASVTDNSTKKLKWKKSSLREVKGDPQDPNSHVAVIKVSNGITLATGFQSVRLDIGVEMPYVVSIESPGMTEGDLQDGILVAYALVDHELTERTKELQQFVETLARKNSHR